MNSPHYYTEEEAAARLHRSPRWLIEWLRDNPTDPKTGDLMYVPMGRSKRFTAEDLVRIFDLILTQEEAPKQRPDAEGHIYFIEGGQFIKIGYTRSVNTRLKKMSTDAPGDLRILHMEPGTFKQEKIVHRHFAGLRHRGEWFRKTPDLLRYIEQRKRIKAGIA